MKRDRLPPDDPREWIRRATSNLIIAGIRDPQVDLADLCFEAQQCAEKSIKAVFLKRGMNFPYVHDLQRLLRLLTDDGLQVPKYVRESSELTQYAHVMRYPGIADPVTVRQYRRAVRIAGSVLRWAERQVASPSRPARGKGA